jgi:hypothetical protein
VVDQKDKHSFAAIQKLRYSKIFTSACQNNKDIVPMNTLYKRLEVIRLSLFLCLFFTPVVSYGGLTKHDRPKNTLLPYSLFFSMNKDGIVYTICDNNNKCSTGVKNKYTNKNGGRGKNSDLNNLCAFAEGPPKYIYDDNKFILAARNIYTVQKINNGNSISFYLIPYHAVSLVLNNSTNTYINGLQNKAKYTSLDKQYGLFFRKQSSQRNVPGDEIKLNTTLKQSSVSKCLISIQGNILSVALIEGDNSASIENFTIKMVESSKNAPYADSFSMERINK